MINIRLCAALTGENNEMFLRQMSSVEQDVDCIELRIDYLLNQKKISLIALKNATKKDIIITCRRQDEGGRWSGSEMDRLQVLQDAYTLGFSYVDVELKTLEEKKFTIPIKTGTKTILSFHDFKKTPDMNELKKIIARMQRFKPHIKKIATMIQNENDILNLYATLIHKKKNDNYCVIGMGEVGKQTRIVAPLLGSTITYCSINSGGTAPGQLSCFTMKEIYKLIQ